MAIRNFAELIERKKAGERLSNEEISWWIDGVVTESIPDYQTAAMLMAVYFRGMDRAETAWMTHCISHSGNIVDLSSLHGIKCDKHSSGGVADTVSIPLMAIVSSCGAVMPKMSGRGLGHTGGTIDKLESIPGFNVNLTASQFAEIVNRYGAAIIAQTGDIAVADKKLYALRDVTATINSVPLIASSIMGKKLASGADVIVLDVKWGTGAFMDTMEEAVHLAKTMVDIGEDNGKTTVAYVTDMNEPLGNAVGNSLEVLEAVEILKGHGPAKLREVILTLSDEVLVRSNLADGPRTARQMALRAIESGKALQRLTDIVCAQGGDASFTENPNVLPTAPVIRTISAPWTGYISQIDAKAVGLAAMHLGAGRRTKEDQIDLSVGLIVNVKTGDAVVAGQPIGMIHARTAGEAQACERELVAALRCRADPVAPWQPVVARISRSEGVVAF